MASERPGAVPEPEPETDNYIRLPGWRGRMMAANPEQARRWMRWAWVCGMVWWVWTIGVLLVWMAAPALAVSEVEGAAPAIPPANLLIYYGIEGSVLAALALGVMRRWRPAAVLLAVGFVVSRIVLILLGLITLDSFRDAVWLVIYGGLLFAFVRGVQGAYSHHWFTRYPLPDQR